MKHILLIDDDETFRHVMSRSMQRRGFEVTTAADSESSLALSGPFNAAVVDLKLGNESGLNLIPQLVQRWPDCKILILTGYSSIATAVEAVKLGAIDYLCKPASVDDILNALQETPDKPAVDIPDRPPSIDRLEWEHIQRILADNNNNISATARELGMHRRTLQRKLQKRPSRN